MRVRTSPTVVPQLDEAMRSNPAADGLICDELSLSCEGRDVPVAVWRSKDFNGPRPLLLLGHGGSQHKTAELVLQLVRPFVFRHGYIAMAVDGPIHGARRTALVTGPERQREFLAMWALDNRVDQMVGDWRVALDHVLAHEDVDQDRVAWCGVSMGTAYGIPLLAADRRISAAVIGMWGSDHPNSEVLAQLAPQVGCRTLFQMKWDDQIFTRAGQFDLFDRLGAKRKWLKVYMGDHAPLNADQVRDIESFLLDI